MACAIHGPQSCGPECSGYLWPAPDAPVAAPDLSNTTFDVHEPHDAPSPVAPAVSAAPVPASRPVADAPAPMGVDMRAIETMQRRVERYIADMGRTAAAAFEAMDARVARVEAQLAAMGAAKVEPMRVEPAQAAKSE